jgi:hypothetical protein
MDVSSKRCYCSYLGNGPDDNEFLVSVDDEALPDVESGSDSNLRAFTFEQLKAATLNFRSNMVLGEGGFGKVYQGWLKEKVASQGTRKRPIAVKRLDSKSKQGYRQWRVILFCCLSLNVPTFRFLHLHV